MTNPRATESGFTIIEVLVAAMILVIAAMTTFGLLSAATKNTERAKATQVALDRAQQEVEKLRSLNNKELALTVNAASSSTKLSPGYRVNAGSGTYALSRAPLGEYEKMVVNGGSLYGGGVVKGGVVNPGPSSFSSGEVHGKVYRYVVWRNDESCSEAKCPGTQDYKQIVVAVKLDSPPNQPAPRGYVEVQSNFVDPFDSSEKDPVPGAEGVVTAQQFFLTDTACSAGGSTTRQEITGDHLLHNTLGTCASGLQNGTTNGAPDALLLGGPPDPAPEDENDPLLYDYSDDFYLEPTPDNDKGVQIRLDDTSGCHYVPTGTTNPQSQVHRWVSDPMGADFKMSGTITLELYTRSLSEITTGGLCIYLYKRHETGSPPVATDTMLTNKIGAAAYWTYWGEEGTGLWPHPKPGKWSPIRKTMTFNGTPYTIPKGDRLGLAVTIDPAKTKYAEALPFMYDHPSEPSRLEVDTSTPIDGG